MENPEYDRSDTEILSPLLYIPNIRWSTASIEDKLEALPSKIILWSCLSLFVSCFISFILVVILFTVPYRTATVELATLLSSSKPVVDEPRTSSVVSGLDLVVVDAAAAVSNAKFKWLGDEWYETNWTLLLLSSSLLSLSSSSLLLLFLDSLQQGTGGVVGGAVLVAVGPLLL